jgi:TolA-binding protein
VSPPAAIRSAAPALLLLLSACWVPIERGRIMEARLDKLEVDAAAQDRRIDEQQRLLKDRVTAADRKLAEVQQKIDELNQAARRSGADLGVQLARLQDEFAKVRGDLEVARHDLDQVRRGVDALDQRTEKRFTALKGRGALDELEAKERIETLAKPDDKAGLLALADKEASAGNRGVARELYDEYVRRWPADPAAAEAAFRSGEVAVGQKRWREAISSFGWIYEKAPRSERVPDAMFGMALAMLEVDDLRRDAPTVLRELVEKHPRTPAAARAKQKLAEIAPPPPAEKKKPAPPRKRP